VNHTISFVDKRIGAPSNTIQSTWRHVKAHLHPYSRQGGLKSTTCRKNISAENIAKSIALIHVVANTN
jgi:hypothetical protein